MPSASSTLLAQGVEMVVVSDVVAVRHHAELLTRHIVKLEDVVRDLEAPPPAASKPPAAAA